MGQCLSSEKADFIKNKMVPYFKATTDSNRTNKFKTFMNFADLKEKAIALIVWNSEKENDVKVFLCKLQLQNNKPVLINEESGWSVSLDMEQLNKLEPVSDELRETLLNADYALSMTMGNLPESKFQQYRATGIKWDS